MDSARAKFASQIASGMTEALSVQTVFFSDYIQTPYPGLDPGSFEDHEQIPDQVRDTHIINNPGVPGGF